MADLQINPSRQSAPIQQNQSKEQNLEKPRQKSQRQERIDQYRRLVDWMQEENRKKLEQQHKWLQQMERKKPSTEELRLAIQKIRSKLRSGGRLSNEERAYLARNAPDELEKLLKVERERSAFKARLTGCKTREAANQAYQSACTSAMGAGISDPDLPSVLIGQFAAALREMTEKPTEIQLAQQDPSFRQRVDTMA